MSTEKFTLTINAPASKIWTVLSDFSNIQMFHPNVRDVDQLSEVDRGVGAARRCNFYDGGSAVEKITTWDNEQRSFTCTVTEIAAPIQDITSSMWVETIDSQRSKVHIEMSYTPKWGILGVILNALVLRFALQSVFKKVLTGLQTHLETGKEVGKNGKPTPGFRQDTPTQLQG